MASLTTSLNAVVAPIHPKAMAVILTTAEKRDGWKRAVGRGEGTATNLPDNALKIVARGEANEDQAAAA